MLDTTIEIATLLGILFMVYQHFHKPDEDIALEVGKMKEACKYKHKAIDDNIVLIKENHLKHIENDLKLQSESIVKIFTILEERLPRKQ